MSVNKKESIIAFKCDSVFLLSSNFCQEKSEQSRDNPKLNIGVEIDVYENRFVSKLRISAKYVTEIAGDPIGHSLSFVIAGNFSCDGLQAKQKMIEVAKLYSLSILWPYAREYASDVFRRSGQPFPVLPIINPQELTKQFIENDSIVVNEKTV